ncbi:hypothetical protein [Nonomuraea guangzhouensis]|uniref:Glycosyl hydrolase family 4 C-terminal domain-containing protein n=1 Tax=Nonomuraea guangzhouensis TaxID=1291555 RepID=A0ABW4GFK4_9ACTN|nr:hypothetical protein [Nonomuraea guangzhouensis]
MRASRGEPTRGQRVAELEATLLDLYRDPALVEKPALLGERGGAYYSEAAVGLPTAPVPPEMAGLIGHVSGYEELALQAALHDGRQRVYRALLAHPLLAQHEKADALTDQLIAAGAQHLAWVR